MICRCAFEEANVKSALNCITCKKNQTLKFCTLFRTFISLQMNFRQKYQTLDWNVAKCKFTLTKHFLDWNNICDNDRCSFTAPSRVNRYIDSKMRKILLSHYKSQAMSWLVKGLLHKRNLQLWSYFRILYWLVKVNQMLNILNPWWFYFQTPSCKLRSSDIFLQVM